MAESTTFSWRNYTRPTPKNLLGIAAGLRRLVAAATGATVLADANHWIPFSILMTGAALDELKNFFAVIVHDTEEAVAEFPSGDQVTVQKEVKKDEEPGGS